MIGVDILLNVIISILGAALIISFIFLLCSLEAKSYRKTGNMIKENPNLIYNIVYKWVPKYFTPIEFAAHVGYGNPYLGYLLCLGDLANKHIIKFKPDFEYIAYPVNYNCNDYQGIILSELDYCRQRLQSRGEYIQCDSGYWLLPTQHLFRYIRRGLTRNQLVDKLVKSKIEYLQCNDPYFDKNALRQDVSTLVKYLRATKYVSYQIVELTTIINNNNNNDVMIPLLYMFTTHSKNRDASGHLTEKAITLNEPSSVPDCY